MVLLVVLIFVKWSCFWWRPSFFYDKQGSLFHTVLNYTHFNMKLGKVPFVAVITVALLGQCSALDEIGSKVDVGGDIFDSDVSLKVLHAELSSNLSVP
jgi:hypothetical protein